MRILNQKTFLFIVIYLNVQLIAAQNTSHTLSGIITDTQDIPLIGATVRIKDSYTGAITNVQGRYEIKNLTSTHIILEVKYIGYASQVKAMVCDKDTNRINFKLVQETYIIDDFIITANRLNEKPLWLGNF